MSCHQEGAEEKRESSAGEVEGRSKGKSSRSPELDLEDGALKVMANWPLNSSPPPLSLELGSGNPALGIVGLVWAIGGTLGQQIESKPDKGEESQLRLGI